MSKYIGADSLAFISIDGLYKAVSEPEAATMPAAILRRLLHRRLPDPLLDRDSPGDVAEITYRAEARGSFTAALNS